MTAFGRDTLAPEADTVGVTRPLALTTSLWPASGSLGAVLLWLNGLLLLMLIGGPMFIIAHVVLIGVALTGTTGAGLALLLAWFLAFLHPSLFHTPVVTAAMRWVILGAAAARTILDVARGVSRVPVGALGVLLFGLVVAALALLVSPLLAISLGKATTFVSGAATVVIVGWNEARSGTWARWIVGVWLTLLGWTLLLSPTPFARLLNGTLQGVFVQPQAMGIFVAPAAAWFTGTALAGHGRPRWTVVGAVVCWWCVFASASRTSLAAVLLGLSVAAGVMPLTSASFRAHAARALRRVRTWIAVAVALPALAGGIFAARGALAAFLLKSEAGGSGLSTEALLISRAVLITRSMDNFAAHPLTGIGLGVPSDTRSITVSRDAGTGFVVSATAEKGFIGSAMLEEVGLPGTAAALLTLLLVLRPAARYGGFVALWTALAALFTNVGESTLVSLGGMGLYVWLVMSAAVHLGRAPGRGWADPPVAAS